LTKFKKNIEYYINLCYSYSVSEGLSKEVNGMPSATIMKNIYNEVVDESQEKESKLNMFIKNMYYGYKIKKIAKKQDYSKYLEVDADICDGKVVVKGTRISPQTVMSSFIYYSKRVDDSDKLIKKIISDYPALDEDKIVYSVLYCFGKGKL